MLTEKQKTELYKIEVKNLIEGNSLAMICIEEIGEFITAYAKYKSGEVEAKELLSEGVDVIHTMYNLLNHKFSHTDIENMVNRKIEKAKRVLKID